MVRGWQPVETPIGGGGISVEYEKSPVRVAGAFTAMPILAEDGPFKDYEAAFGGALLLDTGKFNGSLMGAYLEPRTSSVRPSLFAYGSLGSEVGVTPPPFAVRGVAAGGGWNSRVRVPRADELGAFPFLMALDNPGAIGADGPSVDPLKVLTSLIGPPRPWVIPQEGDLWFAAGVAFDCFKTLRGRAMLLVQTGSELTISLLGAGGAQLPTQSEKKIARLEIGFEVTVKPVAGELSISAGFTEKTFLIDEKCKLRGGVGMKFWFGKHPRAGDFALILGALPRGRELPGHYPKSEPAGLDWGIGNTIKISGTAYAPLKASEENPSTPEERGELIIVGSRRHRDPADVERIKVKVPAGTFSPDLATNLSSVTARISLDGWTGTLNESSDEFVFTPAGSYETIGPDTGFTIQLSRIPISRKVGTAPITVTEYSRTSGSAFPDRSTTFDVGKFPADFSMHDFIAGALVIDNGGEVTLTWKRSTNATYELLYGDTSLNVTNETSRTITNVKSDTTFYLRGTTSSDPTNPVTRILTTQVTVRKPDLDVGNLTVHGETLFNNTVRAMSAVTVTGGMTVEGALTANGTLTANGDVNAAVVDKTVRVADLRGPAGTPLKINSHVTVPTGNNVSIGGSATVIGTLVAAGAVQFATALFSAQPTRKNYPRGTTKPSEGSKWTMTAAKDGFLVVEAASHQWFTDDEMHGRKHRIFVSTPGITYYFDLVAQGKKTQQHSQGI
ncbi:DUF6603 domain-containing protein [Streptomyces sp. NPDC048516]|uniref:DUF6603 domain-containing protein n=1 Tax=Streptomyces sp. NPDC048516 TaxID=3365565 RepID=UPI00371D036B